MAKRITLDSILLILSYLTAIYLKNEPFTFVFTHYIYLFICFITFYFVTHGIISRKNIKDGNNKKWGKQKLNEFSKSWIISSLLLFSIIFIFGIDNTSRFVILGFILSFYTLKAICIIIESIYYRSMDIINVEEIEHLKEINRIIEKHDLTPNILEKDDDELKHIFNLIETEVNIEVVNFIKKHTNENASKTDFHFSNSRFSILKARHSSFNIVNLSKINDIPKINKFFEVVSVKMENNGIFICNAITNDSRKEKLLKKYPNILNHIIYFIYFLYKRLWPKLPFLKKIYFILTKGNDRAISHAEVLGRLYSCGFSHIDHLTINYTTWYAVKKCSDPIMDLNPTYGPIIKLKRVGKNGKLIKVYKIRTMHPFSEYIQEFIYQHNNIEKEGKFKDDFRVSTMGKVFRKIWLDEIPMIINILKGDLKIVGVRPLSKHYLSLYPEDFQEFRTKFKPGLFPPYYVDMPKSLEEIIASEKKYLLLYSKHKFLTDFRYFFIILFNIIFKRARSK